MDRAAWRRRGAGAADAILGAGPGERRYRCRRACRDTTSSPKEPKPGSNVFEALSKHVLALQAHGKRVVIALWSEGARERMAPRAGRPQAAQSQRTLRPGRQAQESAETRRSLWSCSASRPASRPTMRPSSVSRTSSATAWCGRAARNAAPITSSRRRRASRAGDLVVHVDHGIGRFVGLQAITAAGAPHDCLEIHYADAAKLFLPVENVDLLSRYGSEECRRRTRPPRRLAAGRRARRA